MTEFVSPDDLRGYDPAQPEPDLIPVEPTTPETAGNWAPEAGEVPKLQENLQEVMEATIGNIVKDAESLYPEAGVRVSEIDEAAEPEAGDVDILELFAARERGFVPVGGGQPDMAQVRAFVAAIYGEARTGAGAGTTKSLLKIAKQVAEGMRVGGAELDHVLEYPGGPISADQKKMIMRDAFYYFLATSNPAHVTSILKQIQRGEIRLTRTTVGGGLNGASVATRRFLKSLDTVARMHGIAATPDAIRNYVNDPSGSTAGASHLSDYNDYFNPAVGGHPQILEIKRMSGGALVPVSQAAGLTQWTETRTTPVGDKNELYKGLHEMFSGPTTSPVPEGIREKFLNESYQNRAASLTRIGKRLGGVKAVADSARTGGHHIGELYGDIHDKLADAAVRTDLGVGGGEFDLAEMLDVNLSADDPRRKEIVALGTLEKMRRDMLATPLAPADADSPWGHPWETYVARGLAELRRDPPDMNKVLDVLGRMAVYCRDDAYRGAAQEAFLSIIGVAVLSKGPEGTALIDGQLKTNPPDEWGVKSYDYLVGAAPGLAGDRTKKIVQKAEILTPVVRSVKEGAQLDTKAATGAIIPEENRRHLDGMEYLENSEAHAQNFDFHQGIERPITDELNTQLVAEILGLDPTDPEVQEIMRLTDPEAVLEHERGRWSRIFEQLKVRRGALALAAAGSAITAGLAIPVIAPAAAIAAGALAVGGVAYAAVRFFRSVRNSGGIRNALRDMGTGIREAIRLGFRRETAAWFWTAGAGSFLVRALLPGWGTVAAIGAEAAVAVGSEIHLSRKQSNLLKKVTAVREMVDAAAADQPITYTDAAGNPQAENVNVLQYYNRYRLYLQRKRADIERDARTHNRPLTEAEEESLTEEKILEALNASPDNEDRKAAAVVEQHIIPKRDEVQEASQRYLTVARRYSAVLAGSAMGGMAYGAYRLAQVISDFERSVTTPGEKPPETAAEPEPRYPTEAEEAHRWRNWMQEPAEPTEPAEVPPVEPAKPIIEPVVTPSEPAGIETTEVSIPQGHGNLGEALADYYHSKGQTNLDLWGPKADPLFVQVIARDNPGLVRQAYNAAVRANNLGSLRMFEAAGYNPDTNLFGNLSAIANNPRSHYLFSNLPGNFERFIKILPATWPTR